MNIPAIDSKYARLFALLIVIGTSPVFVLFDIYGDPRRGLPGGPRFASGRLDANLGREGPAALTPG